MRYCEPRSTNHAVSADLPRGSAVDSLARALIWNWFPAPRCPVRRSSASDRPRHQCGVGGDPCRTESQVIGWIDGILDDELFITAVTEAELLYGDGTAAGRQAEVRPAGAIEDIVEGDFRDRILPFDHRAASHYGRIVAGRERVGRPIAAADAQIASICAFWGAPLATRNVSDFAGTGIELVESLGSSNGWS